MNFGIKWFQKPNSKYFCLAKIMQILADSILFSLYLSAAISVCFSRDGCWVLSLSSWWMRSSNSNGFTLLHFLRADWKQALMVSHSKVGEMSSLSLVSKNSFMCVSNYSQNLASAISRGLKLQLLWLDILSESLSINDTGLWSEIIILRYCALIGSDNNLPSTIKKPHPCVNIVYLGMKGILSARGIRDPPHIKQVQTFSVWFNKVAFFGRFRSQGRRSISAQ